MPHDEKDEVQQPPRVPRRSPISPPLFDEEGNFNEEWNSWHSNEVARSEKSPPWWWKPPSREDVISVIVIMCLFFYLMVSVLTFLIADSICRQIADYLGISSSSDHVTNVILVATAGLFTPVMVFSLFFTRRAKMTVFRAIGSASQWTIRVWREILVRTLCFLVAIFSIGIAVYYVFIVLDQKTQETIVKTLPIILAIIAAIASMLGHHGIKQAHP